MTKNNKKGFTIIEVVLVLAIAGLIFLMVFIALPALQRSQRNTRRRQDMARIVSAVNDYQANNNGKLPDFGDADEFVMRYIDSACKDSDGDFDASLCGDQFRDPDGTTYGFKQNTDDYEKLSGGKYGWEISGLNFTHSIIAFDGAKCGDSEGIIEVDSGNNMFALAYVLEGGAIYCGDNQ
jgi:prepilin-type N-terminal cleavage/methylation domain-containing protein